MTIDVQTECRYRKLTVLSQHNIFIGFIHHHCKAIYGDRYDMAVPKIKLLHGHILCILAAIIRVHSIWRESHSNCSLLRLNAFKLLCIFSSFWIAQKVPTEIDLAIMDHPHVIWSPMNATQRKKRTNCMRALGPNQQTLTVGLTYCIVRWPCVYARSVSIEHILILTDFNR